LYTVRIRRNSDNKEVDCPENSDWEESSEFSWSEGNMSCDCNRELLFERALGNEPDDSRCSDSRYMIVSIKLPNGEIVYTEDSTHAQVK